MNISIVGTGYVGLVSGVCFAHHGHTVICVDIDEQKVKNINKGIAPIFEKDLEEMLRSNRSRIRATTHYKDAIAHSDITFVCVGTPSMDTGDIDLTEVREAIIHIARELTDKRSFHAVVVKSTVVPGTTRDVLLPLIEKESGKKAGKEFGVGMNPEFLKEGVAIEDFLHPDRVVNGYFDVQTKDMLHALYADFSCPLIETSLTVAEMIKYASNCFLATKISFINEIGNFCKTLGIDVYTVADGMGLDTRIGRAFLNAGIGWGGSCFPKDTSALRTWAHKTQQESHLIDSVITVNNLQPMQLIKILKKYIPDLKGTTIGILGLAFKQDTDDIRESRTIPLVEILCSEGAHVKVYDPKAMKQFHTLFPNIMYCDSANKVLDADAVLIATAWDEFKTLDYSGKLVLDGRRMLEAKNTAKTYEGVCW